MAYPNFVLGKHQGAQEHKTNYMYFPGTKTKSIMEG